MTQTLLLLQGAGNRMQRGCQIVACSLLLLLLPVLATAQTFPICHTLTDPDNSNNKYRVCLTQVTYAAGSSTWTYTYQTLSGTNISHTVFSAPCANEAAEFTGATGCGVNSINGSEIEFTNPDNSTGLTGLKFDCGTNNGTPIRTVSFTLNGVYGIGMMSLGIKAGPDGDIYTNAIAGPTCTSFAGQAIALNLTAECRVGNTLYWRVTGDDATNDVPFSWSGAGSGSGVVDANSTFYFTTNTANGNTVTIRWYDPATNSYKTNVKAHSGWTCVYHILLEKSWSTGQPSGLNNTTILIAESSIAKATCGYNNSGVWTCTYTRKSGNPITSPATPVDLEVPFGETYSVYELTVNGWKATAGVGSGYQRVLNFNTATLPNTLTYQLANNVYSTDIANQPKKFGTHTVVNQPVSGNCTNAVSWLQQYSLIAFGNLTTMQHSEYNIFVGGNFQVAASVGVGLQLNTGNFGFNYGRKALEVAGSVVSGGDISLWFSGAVGPSNTVSQNNPTNWSINGNRTVNLQNGNDGATLMVDYGLAAKAAQIEADLKAASLSLSQATANNPFSASGQNVNINANNHTNGIAVFNLTTNDVSALTSASSISVSSAGQVTTIIINVPGTSITFGNGVNFGGATDQNLSKIIWNFYEATSLTVSGVMKGSVLAPLADISLGNNIDGVLVGKNISIASQSHKPYFTGNFAPLCTPPCDLNFTSLSVSNCISNNYTLTFGLSWTNAPVTGGFQVSINGGAFQNLTRTNFNAAGSQTVDITVPCNTTVFKVEIRFVNSTACNAIAVFPSNPIDPLGYIYCAGTGELVMGGTITVTPPPGGGAIIFSNGLNGKYDFFTDGTVGDYTISYTPPAGYTPTGTPGVRAGDTDDILNPMPGSEDNPLPGANPLVLGSGVTGNYLTNPALSANPFFFTIRITNGTPAIMNNNFPMNCPCASGCDEVTTICEVLDPCQGPGCPTSYPSAILVPGAPASGINGTDVGLNVAVQGNFTVPTNGAAEVEGRIVVGGNFVLDKTSGTYGVGSSGGGTYVVAPNGSTSLLVNGNITRSAMGSINFGNSGNGPLKTMIVAGGTISGNIGVTSGNAADLKANQPISFNFNQFFAYADALSACLASTASTRALGDNLNDYTLSGDGTSSLQIFNLTAADIATLNGQILQFANIPADATIVINVNGGGSAINWNAAGVAAFVSGTDPALSLAGYNTSDPDVRIQKLLFNFVNTPSVTFTTSIYGSVMVPDGDVTATGCVKGRLIVGGNLTHTGGGCQEIHNYPFTGTLPTTCCRIRLDFGDLPITYPISVAVIGGPDANNDGVPDGNNGAVWAGLIVDAELIPQFSANATGDDTNITSLGGDDEDGLTFPSGNLTRGQTYNFTIQTNSNSAVANTRYWALWFDWDNNGTFETYLTGSVSGIGSVAVAQAVTVPSFAVNDYKVRLVVSGNPIPNMPLNVFFNAEVEDYANTVPLPIELLDFKATLYNNQSLLKWRTASEKNNAYFSIQRSRDGLKWQEIGQRKGAGNSQTILNYDFTDANPLSGTNYYRLQQFDTNGDFSFSPIEVVLLTDKNAPAIVYPNPVSTVLNLQMNGSNATGYQVEVFNLVGQQLKMAVTTVQEGAMYQLDTAPLASGVYVLRIRNQAGEQVQTLRFTRR